jgi:hypothetical protein
LDGDLVADFGFDFYNVTHLLFSSKGCESVKTVVRQRRRDQCQPIVATVTATGLAECLSFHLRAARPRRHDQVLESSFALKTLTQRVVASLQPTNHYYLQC